jgi:transposase
MYHLYFSDEEEAEFRKRLAREKDAKVWKRLQGVYSRGQRIASGVIAKNLSVGIDTISVWVKLYRSGGIEGLTNLNYEHQGMRSRLAKYQESIEDLTQREQIPTMGVLRKRIEELYGVEVEESWLSRWCKKKSICLSKRQD